MLPLHATAKAKTALATRHFANIVILKFMPSLIR
jgi:hypothetical protein